MKRIFDILFTTIGLVILSPVLLLIGLLVKRDGGSAFFRQERVGRNGRRFRIYKFRTMVNDAEKLGLKITAGNDSRITPIGRVLRRTKLDELPQLINVFLGQMSLVGPRPEVPKYVDHWSDCDQSRILTVRPGITDYASLIYSDEQALLAGSDDPEAAYLFEVMPKKLALYRRYVAERTLWLDFRIILATLAKIVGVEPVYVLPECNADEG